ncbi:MAG: hypothetical protein IJC85_04285 [Oscillospiraceae bacterium]|nr:hypothetical protein [Oscillospiraceae bacterium]
MNSLFSSENRRKRNVGWLSFLLIASLLFSGNVLAEESKSDTESESDLLPVSELCPENLTVFADMEASSFKVGSYVSSYLRDYARGMRPKNSTSRLSLKTVGYTDLPGVPDSKKALALVISSGGNQGDFYGVRFGGGSPIGTFDSFSKKGNLSADQLKDSGLAFYIDLSDWPGLLSLQMNLTELDCYAGGSYTGRPTTYRVQDRSTTVPAILVNGTTMNLEVYEQHIQVPANFEGWIMIPFAKMQRVRFNSYDANGKFDLKSIDSVSFLFPPDPTQSGKIYLDQISFYGPYFSDYSTVEKPEEDASLAGSVEKDESSNEYSEAISNETSIPSKPEKSERIPFYERNQIPLIVLFVIGAAFLIYIFVYAIRKDLIPPKEKTDETENKEESIDPISEESQEEKNE